MGSKISEDQDIKFECGTQFLRMVGAPGTGKSTALKNLWRYIFENLDSLATKLSIRQNALLHMRERISSSLQPDCFLSFTFTNAGRTSSGAELRALKRIVGLSGMPGILSAGFGLAYMLILGDYSSPCWGSLQVCGMLCLGRQLDRRVT